MRKQEWSWSGKHVSNSISRLFTKEGSLTFVASICMLTNATAKSANAKECFTACSAHRRTSFLESLGSAGVLENMGTTDEWRAQRLRWYRQCKCQTRDGSLALLNDLGVIYRNSGGISSWNSSSCRSNAKSVDTRFEASCVLGSVYCFIKCWTSHLCFN